MATGLLTINKNNKRNYSINIKGLQPLGGINI